MTPVLILILTGGLGALIGSFANVVIHRLPRKESIAFPGSHCPACGHRLGPLELVPILSWVVQRGRCTSCGKAISPRYPLVETTMAAGFVLLALRWPPLTYGASSFPLLILFALLVMLAFIDLDHRLLPDSLTLPAIAVGLLGALWYQVGSGLPEPRSALLGSAAGAGVVVLINRLGGLVLRRFRDTRERLFPLGLDQVNAAALGGALGGWWAGLAAAAGSFLLNLASRRSLRLAEPVLYALWFLGLLVSTTPWGLGPATAAAGSVVAAGTVALVGAAGWWLHDILRGAPDEASTTLDEPVAMGFGDVKLAAVLGAMLGWEKLLLALFVSFVLGALGGIMGRMAGGDRQVPFGPYLVLGGLLALFLGDGVLSWYLGLLTP